MLRAVRSTVRFVLLPLLAGTSGCIGYVHYAAAPLDPRREVETYGARRFDDPALIRFLSHHGAPPVETGFTPAALALAALYFRADVVAAREAVRAARAAEITAGTRPQPSARGTVERAARAGEGGSAPWTVSLTTGLTFETGGKRSARLARARAFTLASELRLQATGWQLAQEARRAAVAALGAERDLAGAEAETAQLRAVLVLLRARYAEGRVSLAEIARAESDVQASVVSLAQVRRTRTDARIALARALGVALSRVLAVPLRPGALADAAPACEVVGAGAGADPAGTLRAVALRERYEVGAALADYAVAEAELRSALARQYPDVNIGPGIAWNQGTLRWLLELGTPSIPLARNRGPIAEALARRAQQAAQATLVEDSVLAQVDSAVAGCRDLRGELAATDSLVAASTEQLRLTEAAYGRGEIGQAEVALARLAVVRVTRARFQAVLRQQAAGVALEAALGRWRTEPGIRWPALVEPIGSPGASGRSPREDRE